MTKEIAKMIHSFLKERGLMLSVIECDYLAKEIDNLYFDIKEEAWLQSTKKLKKI